MPARVAVQILVLLRQDSECVRLALQRPDARGVNDDALCLTRRGALERSQVTGRQMGFPRVILFMALLSFEDSTPRA